jgi:tetratricopeptide (TPR) repeat protein
MYLCLAQRLDLSLEIVTPPGHIYVRYRNQNHEINIETTMRGVHVDSEEYLGIDTIKLQRRNLKDTIGMTHFNQAGIYLQTGDFAKAVKTYEKAKKYLPDDPLVKELLGYALVFSEREEEGRQLLEQVKDWLPDEAVSPNIMVSDYLDGRADAEGFKALFMMVDENSESLQKKRDTLQAAVKRCPTFRSGWLQLATTLLQMHRYGEALESLQQFHTLWPTHVSAEYFLSVVHAERLDYNSAWKHLHLVEDLVATRDHYPKSLKSLRRQLALRAPEVTHPEQLQKET